MNRADLQMLALTRLAEAKVLLAAGLPSGAYYLAGYAVECALKACIAKLTMQYDFHDKELVSASYTHSLRALIRPARLSSVLDEAVKADKLFAANWSETTNWSERSRYNEYSESEAEALISAIDDLGHGVLPWVKLYW